jgi:hypothetical protein
MFGGRDFFPDVMPSRGCTSAWVAQAATLFNHPQQSEEKGAA